jgi:16S rRNA (cytosine967-C5)-methyltransferase
VQVVAADGLRPPFARPFDAVLLDAPCSGLGTLGRHPDIRWRCGPGEPERQSRRQRALLEAQAALVRPGGRLVYATCSVEPEENEQVVDPFLAAHAEFEVEGLPDWAERFRHGRFLRLEPAAGGDAFFVARLRRR